MNAKIILWLQLTKRLRHLLVRKTNSAKRTPTWLVQNRFLLGLHCRVIFVHLIIAFTHCQMLKTGIFSPCRNSYPGDCNIRTGCTVGQNNPHQPLQVGWHRGWVNHDLHFRLILLRTHARKLKSNWCLSYVYVVGITTWVFR